jgi:hypothetical protein
MSEPPRGSRAFLRGDHIRRSWGGKTRQLCSWQAIWNMETKRTLDLSDPFATEERWVPSRPPRTLFGRRLPSRRGEPPPGSSSGGSQPPETPAGSPPASSSDDLPIAAEDLRMLDELFGF